MTVAPQVANTVADSTIDWVEGRRVDLGYDPAPEPRCGQVWVWHQSDIARMVLQTGPEHRIWFGWAGDTEWTMARHMEHWPPPGAVLVAGPGSPWAPMG